jgi:hypothetical protein
MAQASKGTTQSRSRSPTAAPQAAAANAAEARTAALAGTKAAGKALSTAARRSKTPLIGGAAAIAGFAGGLAIIRHERGGRPRLLRR